jgi:hypothetical protein
METLIAVVIAVLYWAVVCTLVGMGAVRDKKGENMKYDPETGKLSYSDPYSLVAGFMIVVPILALCIWWVLSGNFSNSVRMPWG